MRSAGRCGGTTSVERTAAGPAAGRPPASPQARSFGLARGVPGSRVFHFAPPRALSFAPCCALRTETVVAPGRSPYLFAFPLDSVCDVFQLPYRFVNIRDDTRSFGLEAGLEAQGFLRRREVDDLDGRAPPLGCGEAQPRELPFVLAWVIAVAIIALERAGLVGLARAVAGIARIASSANAQWPNACGRSPGTAAAAALGLTERLAERCLGGDKAGRSRRRGVVVVDPARVRHLGRRARALAPCETAPPGAGEPVRRARTLRAGSGRAGGRRARLRDRGGFRRCAHSERGPRMRADAPRAGGARASRGLCPCGGPVVFERAHRRQAGDSAPRGRGAPWRRGGYRVARRRVARDV